MKVNDVLLIGAVGVGGYLLYKSNAVKTIGNIGEGIGSLTTGASSLFSDVSGGVGGLLGGIGNSLGWLLGNEKQWAGKPLTEEQLSRGLAQAIEEAKKGGTYIGTPTPIPDTLKTPEVAEIIKNMPVAPPLVFEMPTEYPEKTKITPEVLREPTKTITPTPAPTSSGGGGSSKSTPSKSTPSKSIYIGTPTAIPKSIQTPSNYDYAKKLPVSKGLTGYK